MAHAAQLHKLGLFEGFGEHIMTYLDNPTPYMPPRRLHWSRLLHRPSMAPPELDQYEAVVLRGEMVRFGDAEVRYAWRRSEASHLTVATGPARAAPRHAWYMCIVTTNQDLAFFADWQQKYGYSWPHVGDDLLHPYLARYYSRYCELCPIFDDVVEAYEGPPTTYAISRALGRNVWTNVQRDAALERVRELARRIYPSIVWAI